MEIWQQQQQQKKAENLITSRLLVFYRCVKNEAPATKIVFFVPRLHEGSEAVYAEALMILKYP